MSRDMSLMVPRKELCFVVVLVGLLGITKTGPAATVEIIADLQNGTITLPQAIELWEGSFVGYSACEATGGTNCFKALIDPDGVVGGEFELTFGTGANYGPNNAGIFLENNREALIPVELFNNRFVGDQPTLTRDAATAIRRTIAFDTNVEFVDEGPRNIANYELFDGGVGESLAGFSPSGSVRALSLDVFDDETGLVITLTPQVVSTDFNVRLVDVVDEDIASHMEAEAIADGSQPEVFSSNVTRNFRSINFGGGTFAGDEVFPDGGDPADDSREQYILTAKGKVDIPAGDWVIAFGSDDGGQLTLGQGEGIDFEQTFGEFEPPGNPGQIYFNGNRAHGWTAGSFSLAAPLKDVDFFASMHERTGGDSFEVAICDLNLTRSQCLNDEISNAVSPENGWRILRDGALGWGVGSTFNVEPPRALDILFREVVLPKSGDVETTTCESRAASRIPGDADGNGEVAFLDFLALANNFGTAAGYEGGDFDCSGDVSFLDFLTLANNFGRSQATLTIPEASSLSLACVGLLSGLAVRRRRCC